jgi:cell division inhibitor SulA
MKGRGKEGEERAKEAREKERGKGKEKQSYHSNPHKFGITETLPAVGDICIFAIGPLVNKLIENSRWYRFMLPTPVFGSNCLFRKGYAQTRAKAQQQETKLAAVEVL